MHFSQKQSVGGKIMAFNEMTAHQKRLHDIYSRAPKHYSSCSSLPVSKKTNRKCEQHEDEEHRKNIKHLFSFISRGKTMADRLKDPHDFYAYPAYFFRVPQQVLKKKSKKHTKRKQQHSECDLS